MAEPARIGLVGCGRLCEVGYLPALHTNDAVRLVGLAEPDPGRRARVAALAGGVPAFADAAALLAEVRLDGLVLATPVSAHLADAARAATAGVPALVEKPPAVDRGQATELAALTPAPWIGFNRRFETGIDELRAAAGGRTSGLDISLEFGYRRGGWGAHAVTDDALLDLGPHLVDLARWITGGEVTAVSRASVSPQRAEFELTLADVGARVRCATNQPYRERVELRERGGRVLGRRARGGLVAGVRDRIAPPGGPHPLVASLSAQLDAFARVLGGADDPTLARADDGLAVMTALDEVRVRAAEG